jgi:predicted RNA-binding Zn ribbon-like protein
MVSASPPTDLTLIQDFVNTVDLEDGTDQLAIPEQLGAWLAEHGLDADDAFSHEDRARAVAVREALRALLLANNERPLDPDAVATLNASAPPLALSLDAEGRARLEPGVGGIDRVFGRLLGIVARAQADGTWARMKACPWHTCHWAFYDASRNHSRTWCSMKVCGNRAKAQTYRRRRGD